jgi:hypothetical protein
LFQSVFTFIRCIHRIMNCYFIVRLQMHHGGIATGCLAWQPTSASITFPAFFLLIKRRSNNSSVFLFHMSKISPAARPFSKR